MKLSSRPHRDLAFHKGHRPPPSLGCLCTVRLLKDRSVMRIRNTFSWSTGLEWHRGNTYFRVASAGQPSLPWPCELRECRDKMSVLVQALFFLVHNLWWQTHWTKCAHQFETCTKEIVGGRDLGQPGSTKTHWHWGKTVLCLLDYCSSFQAEFWRSSSENAGWRCLAWERRITPKTEKWQILSTKSSWSGGGKHRQLTLCCQTRVCLVLC